MPSTTPLTDAINALTQYANETTGASDTTLSDAVGTLVAGYGGGGGGGPLTKLYDNILAQDSRTVTINIEQAWLNYDMLLFFVNGEFTGADWLYYNINSTTLDSGKYTVKQTTLNNPAFIMKSVQAATPNYSLVFPGVQGYIAHIFGNGSYTWSSLSYLFLSGYSHDFKTGTRITMYGGNYANF